MENFDDSSNSSSGSSNSKWLTLIENVGEEDASEYINIAIPKSKAYQTNHNLNCRNVVMNNVQLNIMYYYAKKPIFLMKLIITDYITIHTNITYKFSQNINMLYLTNHPFGENEREFTHIKRRGRPTKSNAVFIININDAFLINLKANVVNLDEFVLKEQTLKEHRSSLYSLYTPPNCFES
ncbi:hypothetical protein BpHYR1_003564 [Brachionus plicatilis]|uniref:Uncharacterized protein n=1 Tax=Brachionus plicatilis TaxID=10195 RepID=A0A3M7QDD9_BRAPC|nr:hypothetical protein BpHYR1_003564 [Brachionus plicatilis]